MEISINKLQIIRPETNPKSNLDLDVDWYVDFKEKSSSSLEYSCTIKTSDEYSITFKISGIVGFEGLNTLMNVLPSIIFDNSMKIMLNMINLTKDTNINIKTRLEELNPAAKTNLSQEKFIDLYTCLDC